MNLVHVFVLWFSSFLSPSVQPCGDQPPASPSELPSGKEHGEWSAGRSACGATSSGDDSIYNGF
ncbi:hypothetical protein L6R53_10880 [Myxococcota bacterium]|nr:hypothetical protein [Myxococcota bacterium]